MKKAILIIILFTGFTFVLKAQFFVLPEFSEKTVVVTIEQCTIFEGAIKVSDGKSETFKRNYTGSIKNPVDMTAVTAQAISQMIDQGYKYIDSNGSSSTLNSSGNSITNYIFRKE
jgi:hypothetical protein